MRAGVTVVATLFVPGAGQFFQGRRALGASFLASFVILVVIGLLGREVEWSSFLRVMYGGALGALYWISGADYSRRHQLMQGRVEGNAPGLSPK